MSWRAWALAVWLGVSVRAEPVFLEIKDLPGESQTEHHAGWIEVEAFAGGIASGRGGVVPGQPTPRTSATAEVTFLKFTDKSSPRLAQALVRGEVFPRARFEFVRGDAQAVRFYVVELEQVLVTSHVTASSPAGRPAERISLGFAQATWTYTEFAASGKPLADHQAQWDFVRQQGGSGVEPRGFRIRATVRPGEAIGLRWNPEPGRRYQLLRSSDPAGPYVPVREIAGSPTSDERFEELPVGRQFDFFLLREAD